jgi:hypothetical protein
MARSRSSAAPGSAFGVPAGYGRAELALLTDQSHAPIVVSGNARGVILEQRWLDGLAIWQSAFVGFCAGIVTVGITAQILGLASTHNWDTSPGMWGAVTGAGIGLAVGETWRRLRVRKRMYRRR